MCTTRLANLSQFRRHLHYSSVSKATNGPNKQSIPAPARRPLGPRPQSRQRNATASRFEPVRPHPPGYDTADAIFRARKYPLLAAGVVALGCGIYVSMMVVSFYSESSATRDATPTGRPPTFTRDSARQFDQSLDASEEAMGITALRRDIGRIASGHVLEVALGTGRNMAFYDWSGIIPSPSDRTPMQSGAPAPLMLSFTGVDISADMLGVAIDKLPKVVPRMAGVSPTVTARTKPSTRGWREFAYLDGRVRVAQCDIQDVLPPPEPSLFDDQGYDTVVQTFGLCSVAEPEQVLSNLAGCVKPGTGRIILVEHGRGWWHVVNTLLDWSALSHFRKYGCWWNRDIVGIVESATKSIPGLRIVQIKRPFITQLGTTVWVELAVETVAGVES